MTSHTRTCIPTRRDVTHAPVSPRHETNKLEAAFTVAHGHRSTAVALATVVHVVGAYACADHVVADDVIASLLTEPAHAVAVAGYGELHPLQHCGIGARACQQSFIRSLVTVAALQYHVRVTNVLVHE